MSKNWKCEACDRVHRKNVKKCRSCGHSILQQTTAAPTNSVGKLLDKLGV